MSSSASKLFIAGAGLSGLIAARMLINRKPVVFDAQHSLPNNHHALLRFRSDAVAVATNTPFSKVRVLKDVARSRGAVADAIGYSLKVTGKLHNRSILNLDPADRWIAPPDFIGRLAISCDPVFGRSFQDHLDDWEAYNGTKLHPIISTIPMFQLMDIMKWDGPRPAFNCTPGWVIKGQVRDSLDSRMSATLYSPNNERLWYRASITNKEFILEGVGSLDPLELPELMVQQAESDFGLPPASVDPSTIRISESQYQKIEALRGADMEHARRFIISMTERHNIFSLGRFATWRPSVLLDDVVNDVRAIERLLDGDSGYSLRL